MVVVPLATAVTNPVDGSMVAAAGFELVHVPPGDVAVQVVVPPAHREVVPEMVKGAYGV